MKIMRRYLPLVASVALGIGVSEYGQHVGLSKLIAGLCGVGVSLIAAHAIRLLKASKPTDG